MLREVGLLFRTVHRKPHLHLGPEDEVSSVHISDDKCWIIVRRARLVTRRNGYIVTHRGFQTILFTRIGPTTWDRDQRTFMDPLGTPERHVTWPGRTPAEHAERVEWEQMCHRPGTPVYPLDNADRQSQGIH